MKALTCSTGGARREAAPAAVFGEIDATVPRSIARAKPRRLSSIATGAVSSILALVFLAALMPMARAAPEERDDGTPEVLDAAACYQLVQDTGRMIAWARWELGAPESNVVVRFEDDTPEWIVDLTNRWIADAYHWEATDDQIRQWTTELGEGTGSSRADQLTTPQTIAIWLRRIARQCSEQRT
jgi:hypothetical protein